MSRPRWRCALRAIVLVMSSGTGPKNAVTTSNRARSKCSIQPRNKCATVWLRKCAEADAIKILLATAHPAKFPDAVEAACGVRPPLPLALAAQRTAPERLTVLPNDQAIVERYVLDHCRIAGGIAA